MCILLANISIYMYLFIFYLGGIYTPIPIKAHLILDFRETKTVRKSYPNTWHIRPNPDFTKFNVINGVNTFEVVVHQHRRNVLQPIEVEKCSKCLKSNDGDR